MDDPTDSVAGSILTFPTPLRTLRRRLCSSIESRSTSRTRRILSSDKTHFIKSVEDIDEALVGAVPGIKFGLLRGVRKKSGVVLGH